MSGVKFYNKQKVIYTSPERDSGCMEWCTPIKGSMGVITTVEGETVLVKFDKSSGTDAPYEWWVTDKEIIPYSND